MFLMLPGLVVIELEWRFGLSVPLRGVTLLLAEPVSDELSSSVLLIALVVDWMRFESCATEFVATNSRVRPMRSESEA